MYIVPTAAELSGNLSDLGVPIYNPFSTRPDPDNPGQFIRDLFPNAQVPAQYLNHGMVLFAKTLFPAPIDTGIAGYNGRDTTPIVTDQNVPNVRIDQQFGEKNKLFFRYTRVGQTVDGSGGFQGLANTVDFVSYNYAASWMHMFGPTAVSQLTLDAPQCSSTLRINFGTSMRRRLIPSRLCLKFRDQLCSTWIDSSPQHVH